MFSPDSDTNPIVQHSHGVIDLAQSYTDEHWPTQPPNEPPDLHRTLDWHETAHIVEVAAPIKNRESCPAYLMSAAATGTHLILA